MRDPVPRLVVGFDGTTVPPKLARLVARGWVAGVVIFARNLEGTRQWIELQRSLVALFPDHTPIIAVDQEGGLVQRLKGPRIPEVPAIPPMGRCASLLDLQQLQLLGSRMGVHLKSLGFNLDFAPVLDVHSQPSNPIIGERAFGTTPALAASRALAWAKGLASAGIVGCGKHFPGHGDTVSDSHLELPRVAKTLEALEAVELAPFRAAVAAGLPMLMTAHVLYPALDADWPATLSERIVRGLLRGAMGYDGVVISDDLDMGAVSAWRAPETLAVRLDAADVDFACVCRDLDLAEELGARLATSETSARRVMRFLGDLPRPVPVWPLPPFEALPDGLA